MANRLKIGGNVSGAVVQVGDGNQTIQGDRNQINQQQGGGLDELLKGLRELRNELGQAEMPADTREMVQEELERAEQAVQADTPKGPKVQRTVRAVGEALNEALEAGGKVDKMIPKAKALGELVARIGLAMGWS